MVGSLTAQAPVQDLGMDSSFRAHMTLRKREQVRWLSGAHAISITLLPTDVFRSHLRCVLRRLNSGKKGSSKDRNGTQRRWLISNPVVFRGLTGPVVTLINSIIIVTNSLKINLWMLCNFHQIQPVSSHNIRTGSRIQKSKNNQNNFIKELNWEPPSQVSRHSKN